VRGYNFGDKAIAGYDVMIRYYDAKGAVVTVKPGTPFEATWDSWSFMGRKYTCEPKAWCTLALKGLEVPASAVKADMLAQRLTSTDDANVFAGSDAIWPGSDKEQRTWPAAFAPWDRDARKAAWQGTWAGEGVGLGTHAAWTVNGFDIKFVDSKGEQTFTLTIDSPCTAGFSGGHGGWESAYTLQNGQLITGLGDAGARAGDKTIVCGGGSVFLLDGTTCTQWDDDFGRWQSKPGTCGFKDDAGKQVFAYTLNGYESKLAVDGDAIWSDQLAHTHATKYPDLAAAKASQQL
jgi:hypothetical protein